MKKYEGLEKYAQVVINKGVNIQEGDELVISSPLAAQDFTRELVRAAYQNKAKRVSVIWGDQQTARLSYDYESEETLCEVPAWHIARFESYVEKGAAYLSVIADDPEIMTGVDPKKLSKAIQSRRKAISRFREATMGNEIRWCIAAYPSLAWAKKISPKLSDEEALDHLWQLIVKTMRMDKPDPVKEWEAHDNKCKRLSKILNDEQFVEFRYTNSLGTDLRVGMPKNYRFTGCGETDKNGRPFIPNLPTEEIFSAPHKDKIEGKLVSAMPLLYQGNRIDNFTLTFKEGKVVDFTAKVGYDLLKEILASDEGASRLGEIALVQYDSPISNLKTLFYDTLFDENASCHFALGSAYPACVEGGNKMSKEELSAAGLNQSVIHIDFMIGTSDLSIVAVKQNGEEMPIFKNGNFCI